MQRNSSVAPVNYSNYVIVTCTGEYLSSSRDHKAVGRRPFDKMATLLAYLGPPEHKPIDSQ